MYIRISNNNLGQLNTIAVRITTVQPLSLPRRLWGRIYHKRSKKRVIRYGLLSANLLLLVIVALFIAHGSGSNEISHASLAASASSANQEDPLDPVSSADIAVHVARLTNLPETQAVVNEAQSADIQVAASNSSEKIIAKPQIVATALKSIKDLRTYTTTNGDTVSQLASKFNITSDTIRWSNNLNSDKLQAGKELLISPVNGLVYTVQAGDTPESLATRYHTNKDQIIKFNDIEISGLKVGDKIVIPDGSVAVTRVAAAPVYTVAYGYSPLYGFNGYDRGWCTWYVASRFSVPNNWGNANTWDNYGALSGWVVSKTPVAGAIGQTDAGWAGHVGVVEEVSADGTMIKYSDMNGLAGFNRVGYSDWVATSRFQNFIYH